LLSLLLGQRLHERRSQCVRAERHEQGLSCAASLCQRPQVWQIGSRTSVIPPIAVSWLSAASKRKGAYLTRLWQQWNSTVRLGKDGNIDLESSL
jgi:hypothetical protein